MRKLRLIKPWRLRTIRQRTNGEEGFRTTPDMMVPCCGPREASNEVVVVRTTFIDLRSPIKMGVRIFHPAVKAPDSNAVLVAKRNIAK